MITEKNKEEIEKVNEEIEKCNHNGCKGTSHQTHLYIENQIRIKTSIEWCEDEIKLFKSSNINCGLKNLRKFQQLQTTSKTRKHGKQKIYEIFLL
jgi:hypothetical protein